MMEFYEVIDKRRTVRNFSAPAPDEIIRKIILTGTKALDAGNRQDREFVIISDPELVKQVAEIKYQCNLEVFPRGVAMKQRDLYRNTSAVAVCHKNYLAGDLTAWCAIQNMALAATAEGYGILPSTFWGKWKRTVADLLGLPADYEVAAVVLVGKQKGNPPRIKKRPDFSWLHINKYGNKA